MRTAKATVGVTKGHQFTSCPEHTAYTTQARASESRYVVRTTYYYDGVSVLDHEGPWYERERAVRFASSCDGYWREADREKAKADRYCFTEVVEVEPYWYVCGFGRVEQVTDVVEAA